MPDITDHPPQTTKIRTAGRTILTVVLIVMLLLMLLTFFFCCGLPLITGQACFDFLSGHVPPRATARFLDSVFEATVAQDYVWLATVSEHFARVGKGLRAATDAYNRAVSSIETRVLVSARKFRELGVSGGKGEIESLPQVESTPRMLQAPELAAGNPGDEEDSPAESS